MKQAGAISSGLLGGLAGAGIGAAGGYFSADPNDPDPEAQKRRAMIGGLVGAGVGGLGGTAMGALGEAGQAKNQLGLAQADTQNQLQQQSAEHLKALQAVKDQLAGAQAASDTRAQSLKTMYTAPGVQDRMAEIRQQVAAGRKPQA